MSRKRKFKLKAWMKVVIFTMAVLYFGITVIQQEFTIQDQAAQQSKIKMQIQEAQDYNNELQRKISYTNSDDYIEKTARETLGWVKPGEVKFMEKNNN